MGFEAGQIYRIGRQTAAGGDDHPLAGSQFKDKLLFQLAKSRFTVFLKNIRNGPARARLNQFIRVEIIEVQLISHQPSHGGLARAHETNEREIDEVARVVHGHDLADFQARRTPIIGGAGAGRDEALRRPIPASRPQQQRQRLAGTAQSHHIGNTLFS